MDRQATNLKNLILASTKWQDEVTDNNPSADPADHVRFYAFDGELDNVWPRIRLFVPRFSTHYTQGGNCKETSQLEMLVELQRDPPAQTAGTLETDWLAVAQWFREFANQLTLLSVGGQSLGSDVLANCLVEINDGIWHSDVAENEMQSDDDEATIDQAESQKICWCAVMLVTPQTS